MTDYKSYALSAARSKAAYMAPEKLDALWAASSTEGTLEYELFHGVPSKPRFYSSNEINAQAYIWKEKNTLHVVFRGTQEGRDMLVDLNVFRSYLYPDSKLLVHSGFLKQFRSLEKYITQEITDNFESIDNLHFTGHSLGAGLATLAAAYYGDLYKNIINIICHTIGSPRVGNVPFTEFFKKNVNEHVRIMNEKDPVPLLPISFLYTHVPDSICINDECVVDYEIKDIPWYWRLVYLPFSIDFRSPVKCHTCDLYITRLLKLANLENIQIF